MSTRNETESVEQEFRRRFKYVPEHLTDGYALILDVYPALYTDVTDILATLNNMSSRFEYWKQQRIKELGFKQRKLKREHNNGVPLADVQHILTSDTDHTVKTREAELQSLFDAHLMHITILLDLQEHNARLALTFKRTVASFRQDLGLP